MPRRGLPQTVQMRHDSHYVEALAASSGAPIGRMIPIEQLDPNPDQPRQVMGDLSELMASIAEKGIIEPLIVRQQRGRFQIIAGERRYQAAVQVEYHFSDLRVGRCALADTKDTSAFDRQPSEFDYTQVLHGLAAASAIRSSQGQ